MDLRFVSASATPPTVPALRDHLIELADFELAWGDDDGHEWLLGLAGADGEHLVRMWGSSMNAATVTVGKAASHVVGPLHRLAGPDEVDQVERRRLDLRTTCATNVTDAEAREVVQILSALLDDFDLEIADQWGHLIARSDVEALYLAEVDETRSLVASNRAIRQVKVWLHGGQLFALPRHPTDWFLVDGEDVAQCPNGDDDALGAFVREAFAAIQVDRANPDVSQRFPDGEAAVIRASGARTKTAFYADARFVTIHVHDDRAHAEHEDGDHWVFQPYQNRGPRKGWSAATSADVVHEVAEPSDREIAVALHRALRHFDGPDASTPA